MRVLKKNSFIQLVITIIAYIVMLHIFFLLGFSLTVWVKLTILVLISISLSAFNNKNKIIYFLKYTSINEKIPVCFLFASNLLLLASIFLLLASVDLNTGMVSFGYTCVDSNDAFSFSFLLFSDNLGDNNNGNAGGNTNGNAGDNPNGNAGDNTNGNTNGYTNGNTNGNTNGITNGNNPASGSRSISDTDEDASPSDSTMGRNMMQERDVILEILRTEVLDPDRERNLRQSLEHLELTIPLFLDIEFQTDPSESQVSSEVDSVNGRSDNQVGGGGTNGVNGTSNNRDEGGRTNGVNGTSNSQPRDSSNSDE